MTIRGDELLNAAELLAKEQNVKVTVKHSVAGGALTGFSSMAGGVALGPLGLAIGGIAGGLMSYIVCKDRFKPLHEIIAHDLSSAQRKQLAEHIRAAIADFDITDVATLATLIMNSSTVRGAVLNTAVHYAQNELKLAITQ